ncbi:hypothetical protein QBC34DRAFT_163646 [Podospora aff. communis PSN243]|uniref:BTB domain-containing protein n=1 Tax=Podospora aff. communis PSN243 TaxID=3040156 RepID=A0AAV9GCI1_9PEZI|nr:hypothetical protein QBC34DRAFT_163646 [Podospora aff. communis PSN243]
MMAPKTSAPPKSTGSSHPATIHIDKDGDLTLIISQNEQEFTVCSKALSQATPVFKVMLYGNFNEAKPADASIPWIVRLPDDDAEAATLLLNATHSNFDRMPKKVNAGNLHQALIFADKYDLTRYLDPWMHKWMNPHIKNLRRRRPDIPSSFAECCAIMGILNATGQRKWLCRMVDILCRNTRIGPAGTSASKAAITTVGVSVYTKISDHINSPFIPDAVGGGTFNEKTQPRTHADMDRHRFSGAIPSPCPRKNIRDIEEGVPGQSQRRA